MRPRPNRVADNMVFIMPDFIHEFGDSAHHMSMRRTMEFDEDDDWIPGTGPNNLRYWLHEFLDDNVFYPTAHWISDIVGDNDLGQLLREFLGFFWGLNCGFPKRDVALHTVWTLRGCKPLAVFKRRRGKWVKTYPDSTRRYENLINCINRSRNVARGANRAD